MSRYSIITVLFVAIFTVISFSHPSDAAEHPNIIINGQTLDTGVPARIDNGRTLVPMRSIFNVLGAEVDWDAESRVVTAKRSRTEIKLPVGEKFAFKNGKKLSLDAAPEIRSGHTLVPLRFVSEAFKTEVNWNGKEIIINDQNNSGTDFSITTEEKNMGVGGSQVKVTIAKIPPEMKLTPTVALGNKKVGGVEKLSSMASRWNAVLAVNGTFFNPKDYVDKNGLPTEPYGTIIRNGKLLHVGSYGAVAGFKGLDMNIEQLRVKIEGSTEGSYGWPNNWYAYGVNHTPSPGNSSVYIYTPERGQSVGYDFGTKVVVSDGSISRIVKNRNSVIPQDGFVITLEGKDGKQLKDRFSEGVKVGYRVKYTAENKNLDWKWTDAAVGAGPQLIDERKLLKNYREQGFTEDKILTNSGRRTAIGEKENGTIVIAVADSATVYQMAKIMRDLGTVEAMNLDGGASSGLWVEGKTLVNPGRKLSNALLFTPKKD